jgi:hypothetical protein
MLTYWDSRFPNCKPVAHHLPVVFPERWVRFHSLPASKRYPATEAEYATVLARHNKVLGELAGYGETVALLTTDWSNTAEPIHSRRELLELNPLALPWRTVALHQLPDNAWSEPTFWHVSVSDWRWSPGVFDPLVRLTADDVLGNIMIVALDCKWLLHSYGGGMDLIVESRAARDALAERYAEWLAPEWRVAGDARDVGLPLHGSQGLDT